MKKIRLSYIKFSVLFLLMGAIIVFGIKIYNNQFFAKKVISSIEQQDIKRLQKLMKSPGGNLNCKPTIWILEVFYEKNELTPLQVACRCGNPEIVKLLLDNGADPNYTHWDKTRNQGSPLINAVGSSSDKRLDVVKLLIQYGADINYEDSAGNDALSCVVYASFDRYDTIEIIEYLEKQGMNIEKKYSTNKNTLLHKACERDDSLVIRYLIEKRGFDVNVVNEDGDTPLIYFLRFASNRKKKTLLFLMQSGADPKIKNNDGKTAYYYAAKRHPEYLDLLTKTEDG